VARGYADGGLRRNSDNGRKQNDDLQVRNVDNQKFVRDVHRRQVATHN
jgi:hypothetical protein